MTDLIGAWSLLSSINYRDEVPTPSYGSPAAGQLQYTADGRMSAFLMDPAWAARNDGATIDSFNDFFAYAGRWRVEGDQVIHDIEFASAPARVGAQFVRTLAWVDGDTIRLDTAPEVSGSGKTYITRLLWRRYAGR